VRLPRLTGRRTSADPSADEPADTGGGTATATAPEPGPEPGPEQQQEPKQEPKQEKAVTTEQKSKQRMSGRDAGRAVVAGANAVRSRIASLVWLVAVVCALFLAVGALLIALDMNQANPIVGFICDTARKLDFGSFKDFTGKNAHVKSVLTNWGIAAVIYLVAGKVLDRVIRP